MAEMTSPRARRLDSRVTDWLSRSCLPLLRIALGVVFLWFGALKFFPGLSPADELATQTIHRLTFGMLAPEYSRPILAAWESIIGLGLITGVGMRIVLPLMALQMAGTVTPLFLFPELTWSRFPIAPTLEGQYIIKNVVLVTAALVLGATVRGGAVVASPHAAHKALAEQAREVEAAEREAP